VGDDYPYYISTDYSPGFRVERVTRALLALEQPTAADMARVHAERQSIPALTYIKLLRGVEPADPASALARELLLAWDGRLDADRVEPTIYSAWRDALLRELLWHHLGDELADLAWHPNDRGRGMFYNRFKTLLVELIPAGDRRLLPPGQEWPTLLSRALQQGVAQLTQLLGPDPKQWRWDRLHQARPRHTLSAAFPELAELLDPPPIPMSGDADTPLAGSYSPADPATVTGLSVARYSFDLADWEKSLWAIPLGASGHPGSPHYHDQSETWRQVKMVPMLYNWEGIAANSESEQTLEPA
jgi:penicillin amidase